MSSDRKIAANRRNALKSTGPRFQRGKRHSRFNAFVTGAYADPRLLSVAEGQQLNVYRQQIQAERPPVGIDETTVADEYAFNLIRRDRVQSAEGAFFEKVRRMELVRLGESLTVRQRKLLAEIIEKRHAAGKIPGPPETDDEDIKFLEYMLAMIDEPQHLVEFGHIGNETRAMKQHLDRQRRAIFKDILANISALKEMQRERLGSVSKRRK